MNTEEVKNNVQGGPVLGLQQGLRLNSPKPNATSRSSLVQADEGGGGLHGKRISETDSEWMHREILRTGSFFDAIDASKVRNAALQHGRLQQRKCCLHGPVPYAGDAEITPVCRTCAQRDSCTGSTGDAEAMAAAVGLLPPGAR
jgi:hypothetical protein